MPAEDFDTDSRHASDPSGSSSIATESITFLSSQVASIGSMTEERKVDSTTNESPLKYQVPAASTLPHQSSTIDTTSQNTSFSETATNSPVLNEEWETNSNASSLSLDAQGFLEARERTARAEVCMARVEENITKWKAVTEEEQKRRARVQEAKKQEGVEVAKRKAAVEDTKKKADVAEARRKAAVKVETHKWKAAIEKEKKQWISRRPIGNPGKAASFKKKEPWESSDTAHDSCAATWSTSNDNGGWGDYDAGWNSTPSTEGWNSTSNTASWNTADSGSARKDNPNYASCYWW